VLPADVFHAHLLASNRTYIKIPFEQYLKKNL
jgi:hypothetical protein